MGVNLPLVTATLLADPLEAAPSVPKNILLTLTMLRSRAVDKTATTDKTSVPRDNCCCYF